MQPPQEWIDRYPEAWDEEHGAYRGQNGYLPHPRPRAAYAAMISDLDEHVGAILQTLEQLQLSQNTLVVFTSDNGPTHGGRDPNFHIGGAACTFFESTGGLRGFKGSCYEGGIRVPCLMRWPGVIEPGTSSAFPSYFPDWFITLAQAASVKRPPTHHDGVDLIGQLKIETDHLANDQAKPEQPATDTTLTQDSHETTTPSVASERVMIWDFAGYGGIAAIRQGRWKGIRRELNRKNEVSWELYDLQSDEKESNDLSNTHPKIMKRLETLWLANRVAEPDFPNRTYDQP